MIASSHRVVQAGKQKKKEKRKKKKKKKVCGYEIGLY